MSVADLRSHYMRDGLDEEHVDANPIKQFSCWLDEAFAAEVREPNAMVLATADLQGRPSARVLLLKGFDHDGFVFFTNYESRKGIELNANPRASLLFFWAALQRQVRIEGDVERVSPAESDRYFASRPLASRIGAWASPQSKPIASRASLMVRVAETAVRHGLSPRRPPNWGGYRLLPASIEFWQGRSSRMYDRLLYTCVDGSWSRLRLAPVSLSAQ